MSFFRTPQAQTDYEDSDCTDSEVSIKSQPVPRNMDQNSTEKGKGIYPLRKEDFIKTSEVADQQMTRKKSQRRKNAGKSTETPSNAAQAVKSDKVKNSDLKPLSPEVEMILQLVREKGMENLLPLRREREALDVKQQKNNSQEIPVAEKQAKKLRTENMETEQRESEWKSPRKTCKAQEKVTPMEVTIENKYEMLNDQAAQEAEMIPARISIPPIVFQENAIEWLKIDEIFREYCTEQHESTMKRRSIHVHVQSIDDYRKVTKVLSQRGIPFHTYQLANEKHLKVILKNLTSSVPEEAILADLQKRKFPALKVKQFSRRSRTEVIKLPIYLVELENTKEGKSIFQLNNVFSMEVKVEKFSPKKRPVQCFRCQDYGHTVHLCTNQERCCKCGLPHRSSQCEKSQEEKPICYFCAGEHVSSYRGCPVYQKRFEKKKQEAKKAKQNAADIKINDQEFPALVTSEMTPGSKDKPTYSEKVKTHPRKRLNIEKLSRKSVASTENSQLKYLDMLGQSKEVELIKQLIIVMNELQAASTVQEKLIAIFKAVSAVMDYANASN